MAGVNVPQKRDSLGQILQTGGAIAGGILASPGGAGAAAGGAALGSSLGSTAGNMLGGNTQGPAPVQTTAISRRIESTQQAPQVQLAQADAALSHLPPEVQKAYGPTLTAARKRAEMEGA